MVCRGSKAAEPLQQVSPTPARLLLAREKGGALKARLKEIDENCSAHDIVQLSGVIAVVDAQTVAERNRRPGGEIFETFGFKDKIVAMLADVAPANRARPQIRPRPGLIGINWYCLEPVGDGVHHFLGDRVAKQVGAAVRN